MVLIILTLININIPYKILRLKTTFVRKIILTQQQRVKVVQNQQERMTKGKEEEKTEGGHFWRKTGRLPSEHGTTNKQQTGKLARAGAAAVCLASVWQSAAPVPPS